MPSLYSRLLFIATLVMCLGAETDPDGRLFQPSVDPLADVQQALSRAEAIWCSPPHCCPGNTVQMV
jgi:hypothetical protein